MAHITLTEEQYRLLAETSDPIEVQDPMGHVVGRLIPPRLAELLAMARNRLSSNQPRYRAEKVHACLGALEEEWQRTGGFDEGHLRSFLLRLKAEGST